MRNDKIALICAVILVAVHMTASVAWERVQCSKDAEQSIPDGSVANIGRFPWLGVVQHSFYIGGSVRFAITAAVLIHPSYAIAPAEDIARILRDQLLNNTKFIIWYSQSVKYAMNVNDYILHPEHEEQKTLATIALLELETHGETAIGENKAAVLPVCLPITGGGTFTDLYAVKMTDENIELQKEVYKMQYVNDKDCEDFYLKNKLTYSKMTPVSALCASTEQPRPPCVWDGGTALITRQSWGFWKLLGFSVRGPGCGAPARFLILHDYLQWLDEVLAPPEMNEDDKEGEYAIGFRRLSPIKIVMYNANTVIPKEIGNCDRKLRGGILYKDSFEVTMTKDFGQGFFYVIVSQIAQFSCAVINFEEATAKSNTALWLEHYCHREITGIAHGQKKPRDYRRQECFLYFKSAAFVKFRFYFSFKAMIEMSLYGTEEVPRYIPNPFQVHEVTEDWYPTQYKDRLKIDEFVPVNLYYWML